MCLCDECEMLKHYPMKVTAKKSDDLLKYLKIGDKIGYEQSINGEIEYYAWINGYKCLYNAETSLEKKELPNKGNCRRKGGR